MSVMPLTAAFQTTQVQHQLEQALRNGQVPDDEKRRAAQLLQRLTSTVQIVLVGAPKSGKSRLVNLLTGMTIVPDKTALPPLEVRYGPDERTVYLMADGSEQYLDGLTLDQPMPADTAIVRTELPLPVLNEFSLTEVSLEGSATDQRTMAEWAMNRADIMLWCSPRFEPNERALWASANDTLRGHSILLLTKADQMQMEGRLTDRLDHLRDVVAEEFLHILPIASIQAFSANSHGGPRDETLWTASGGRAFSDAVHHLVATGRRADADNALLFLKRISRFTPEDFTRPFSQGSPLSPAPQPAPVIVDQKDSPATDDQNLVLHHALDFLQQRSDHLAQVLTDDTGHNRAYALDHCLETANDLTHIIMDSDPDDPSIVKLQDDVMECSDMIVLYHLEKTEDAATDAITVLLQLKKEMAVAVSH